jgi:hypothetical protein
VLDAIVRSADQGGAPVDLRQIACRLKHDRERCALFERDHNHPAQPAGASAFAPASVTIGACLTAGNAVGFIDASSRSHTRVS